MATAEGTEAEKFSSEVKTVFQNMQDLLETGRQWDVELVAGVDPERQTYKAHKLILAANSSVFHAMFYGSLKTVSDIVELPDVDPEAFLVVLKYIYTGHIKLNDVEDACCILYISKKYLLMKLIVDCREFISDNLCVENVCYVYGFLKHFEGEDKLAEMCVQIIQSGTADILSSEGFLRSSRPFIEKLLSEEHLNIDSESTLITSIIAWGEAEMQRKNLPLNKTNRREVLNFAIPKIRFLSLTAEEFTEMKDMLDLFSPSEYCSILSNIVQPLPENVCLNRKKRSANTENDSIAECLKCFR